MGVQSSKGVSHFLERLLDFSLQRIIYHGWDSPNAYIFLTDFRNTGGPRLVRILGPGKNRTSEIRTSRYYVVNFHITT